MAPDAEVDARPPHDVLAEDNHDTPLEPSTPQETGPQLSSQVTLPSTEIPGSPIDPNQSFKTEANDDRPAVTVIPSSLTPPPSTQVAAPQHRRTFSQSQQSALYSPPATVLNHMRDRQVSSDYVAPAPHQVLEASSDELRVMLQTCIADHQRLKMETAHHKLQFNLLSMQAEDESKRAAVEHDMVRREVDALRTAEHTRQAKRELSTSSESTQAKYLQMKMWYEAAVEENETLQRRLHVAKKVIQQKEEETVGLTEERDMLLTRIRENREHFHMLCSPGGIFHGTLTPKQQAVSTPQQQQRTTPRQTPRSIQRDDRDGREHGLSALLQAMSQSQDNNNSAPTSPLVSHRAVQRHTGRHNRNAQSMSSLPTTPKNRGRDSGLLPSVDLVPQTEPRPRYSRGRFGPTSTPTARRRRKSRESTISADDNEELTRQAMESVGAAARSMVGHRGADRSRHDRHGRGGGDDEDDEDDDDEEVFDSQASQAATELLRRDPRQSFEVAASSSSQGISSPVDGSARLRAKMATSSLRGGDKRKFSGAADANDDGLGSPAKRTKLKGTAEDDRRVGLGIQYDRRR